MATSFLLDYKVFNELRDTSLALSRSAFFVNQVTCLWAPATLMELVELGQQGFSVECEYVCFRLLFSTEAMDKEPSLSKVTNGKKKKLHRFHSFSVFSKN